MVWSWRCPASFATDGTLCGLLIFDVLKANSRTASGELSEAFSSFLVTSIKPYECYTERA